MTERPVIVERGNSAAAVILALVAAGVIAFALWFFVIDNDRGDDVLPNITETSIGG